MKKDMLMIPVAAPIGQEAQARGRGRKWREPEGGSRCCRKEVEGRSEQEGPRGVVVVVIHQCYCSGGLGGGDLPLG